MKHVVYAAEIALGVRQATAGYHDVVELEDALQEGLLAFYAIQWPEECDDPERMVTSKVRSAVREFCERERGARFGYEAFDQFAYSPKWVRALLPEALSYELTGDLPQAPAELRVSGGSGGSDGRDMLCQVLDVLEGLAGLGDRDRDLLGAVFFAGHDDVRVAVDFGLSEESVRRTVGRAVGRLCRRLNDRRRVADSEHVGPGARGPRRVLRRVVAHEQPELQ